MSLKCINIWDVRTSLVAILWAKVCCMVASFSSSITCRKLVRQLGADETFSYLPETVFLVSVVHPICLILSASIIVQHFLVNSYCCYGTEMAF